MKISVSSYSYQNYINAGKMTQADCVEKAKESGFDAIEFIELSGADVNAQLQNAKEIKSRAEKAGIEICAYLIGANMFHVDETENQKEIDRVKHQIDVAAELGAKIFRHDVCYSVTKSGNARSFYTMLPKIAENINVLTEYAKTFGIKTCVENHGYIAQDSIRMEQLYATVNNDNFGLLIDIGNFACADDDSVLAMSRLAPYAVHCHAKDFKIYPFGTECGGNYFLSRACNKLKSCVVCEGNIKVAQCLTILKHSGYEGYVSIEFEGAEDCLAAIDRGYANLKSVLNYNA